MTQEEINNTAVDVVYDKDTIYHVLEPNTEGIREAPVGQFLIRKTISEVQINLQHLDLVKLVEYIEELQRESNEAQIKIE